MLFRIRPGFHPANDSDDNNDSQQIRQRRLRIDGKSRKAFQSGNDHPGAHCGKRDMSKGAGIISGQDRPVIRLFSFRFLFHFYAFYEPKHCEAWMFMIVPRVNGFRI